jgi:hypothetical protein
MSHSYVLPMLRKTRKSPDDGHESTTDRQIIEQGIHGQRGKPSKQPTDPLSDPQSTASSQTQSNKTGSFTRVQDINYCRRPSTKPDPALGGSQAESPGNMRSNSPGLKAHSFQSMANPAQEIGLTETQTGRCVERSAMSDAQKELKVVSEQFAGHYNKFLSKHKQYVRVDKEIQHALEYAEGESDIYHSASVFKECIENVLELKSRKEERSRSTWHSKVGRFLTALYPVAKISVGIISAAADVCAPFNCLISNDQGSGFYPLKGAATGVSLILQVSPPKIYSEFRRFWKLKETAVVTLWRR